MPTTVLSSKGQVIIPKVLRETLRWGPGTRLEVRQTPEGVLMCPTEPSTKVPLAQGLAALRQRVGYTGPVRSLAQMDAEVLRQAGAPTPGRSGGQRSLRHRAR